jgi:hypothetical protein
MYCKYAWASRGFALSLVEATTLTTRYGAPTSHDSTDAHAGTTTLTVLGSRTAGATTAVGPDGAAVAWSTCKTRSRRAQRAQSHLSRRPLQTRNQPQCENKRYKWGQGQRQDGARTARARAYSPVQHAAEGTHAQVSARSSGVRSATDAVARPSTAMISKTER